MGTHGVSALYFVHTDHLGSVSLTTDGSGAVVSEQKFTAWGVVRAANGAMPTDIGYTGQYADKSTGLMFYGARYYDAYLNRFISADTVVPQAGNPQDYNRYSYARNNPLKYTDPSGHCPGGEAGEECRELQQQAQEMFKIKLSGDWSKDDLTKLFDGLDAVTRAVGGIQVFHTIWSSFEFRRFHDPIVGRDMIPELYGPVNSPYAGLTLWGLDVIEIFDRFDKFTIAHELGHAMDYRMRGQATTGLVMATGSTISLLDFEDPTLMEERSFSSKGMFPFGNLAAAEDWASAFEGFVYPEKGLARITGGSVAGQGYSLFADPNHSKGNAYVGRVLQNIRMSLQVSVASSNGTGRIQ